MSSPRTARPRVASAPSAPPVCAAAARGTCTPPPPEPRESVYTDSRDRRSFLPDSPLSSALPHGNHRWLIGFHREQLDLRMFILVGNMALAMWQRIVKYEITNLPVKYSITIKYWITNNTRLVIDALRRTRRSYSRSTMAPLGVRKTRRFTRLVDVRAPASASASLSGGASVSSSTSASACCRICSAFTSVACGTVTESYESSQYENLYACTGTHNRRVPELTLRQIASTRWELNDCE